MSSSSTVTGPRGSAPPRRSTSCIAFSPQETETRLLAGTASRHWHGRPRETVPLVGLASDLVQEFVHRMTDALEASGLRDGQIRTPNIPAFRRDLLACEVVFHLWAVNPRISLAIAEQQINGVGNLRREVFDIGVPLAVVSGGEE